MIFSKDYSHLLLIPEGKEGAIAIPGSTKFIPAQALSLCHLGSSLSAGDGSTAFTTHDRMLFSKDMKTLVACPPAYGKAVVLPTETESIGEYALAGCKDLASITVLGNIQKIDPTAFADEIKASAVVALPAGNDYETRKSVWENAGFQHFAEPAHPGVITNPNNNEAGGLIYTLLDDYTLAVSWQGKEGPEANLEIPSSTEINGVPYRVSAISENAFANRGSLISVKLPTTITTINNAAFAGCANLSSVEFPNTLCTIGERAFEATSLKDVWLPDSIESISSRAFASCESLERVVALGTPEVATDTLAGCTKVSIYIPSGSENSWNPGLSSDGNHLMPYGIALAEDSLAIEAGQGANLLEGGNLQAPNPIEASYSYAASPLSVDDGHVSAKKAGTTDVTAILSLNDVELARATRTVEVYPSPESEPNIVQLTSEVPLPGTYLADLREASAPINVVAPFAATFGQDAPYDVVNPPSFMEAPAKFTNNMDVPVRIAEVECTQDNIDLVLAKNDTASTPLFDQTLFSLYPEGVGETEEKVVSFGINSPINKATPKDPSAFTISPKSTSSYLFRLNLTNGLADAKVRPEVADNGVATRNLGSVKYTFKAEPLLGFGSGTDSSSFYLKDKTTGEVYTAAQVKAHADAIARGNEAITAAYQDFMANENTYECKTIWANDSYDVRIIGIDHDELSKPAADGCEKAGLTFQFVNLLNAPYPMNSLLAEDSATNAGGWGASELRANMNPGKDNPSYGNDTDAIWGEVPKELQDSIAVVKKYYNTTWNSKDDSTVEISSDKLFIASYFEHTGSVYTGISAWANAEPWLVCEGKQYAYWSEKVERNTGENAYLKKVKQANATGSAPSSGDTWWQRTVDMGNPRDFLRVDLIGSPSAGSNASGSFGVCPCFCF